MGVVFKMKSYAQVKTEGVGWGGRLGHKDPA